MRKSPLGGVVRWAKGLQGKTPARPSTTVQFTMLGANGFRAVTLEVGGERDQEALVERSTRVASNDPPRLKPPSAAATIRSVNSILLFADAHESRKPSASSRGNKDLCASGRYPPHQRDPSRHGGRLPDILRACRSTQRSWPRSVCSRRSMT